MKTTLTSGNSYSIKNIFGGDYKIVIPDMQREYCWATVKPDNETKSLITLFIEDLIKSIQNESIQLGLLYAYEGPKNYIQLCDGQQRLTSLYLLIGCLYQAIEDNELSNGIKKELRKVLITDETFSEPRLQYAIRETTLFFLKDLVKNYFLGEISEENIDGASFIKKQDWYFQEYNQDPTIQNMLLAIDSINSLISEFKDKPSLANHILKNISFMYFDMENRTHGEEQFVVINTTGESLTVTENIKPKILGDLDDSIQKEEFNNKTTLGYYAEMWEKWEQYFWEHKNKSKKTVDFALNEFFRWIYIIESVNKNDSYSAKPVDQKASQKAVATYAYNIIELLENRMELLELIDSYFEALKNISLDKELKDAFLFKNEELGQANVLRFLPLLTFVHSINSDINNRNYIRLKQFLKTRSKDDNVTKASIITSVEAIRMVKVLKSKNLEDIAVLVNVDSNISITLLNKLERFKFNILRGLENRIVVENAFWKAEDLNTTNGNLAFMFFSQQRKNKIEDLAIELFDFEEFKKVKTIVENIFEKHSDLMRRSLLTFGHYYEWHGHTTNLQSHRYTLGNNSQFYGDIANNSEKEHQKILLEFIDKASNIQNISIEKLNDWMQNTIDNFISSNSDVYEKTRSRLISIKKRTSEMDKKLFCISYDKKSAYILFQQKVTSENSYRKL